MRLLNFAGGEIYAGLKARLFIQVAMVITPLFLSRVINGPRCIYRRGTVPLRPPKLHCKYRELKEHSLCAN